MALQGALLLHVHVLLGVLLEDARLCAVLSVVGVGGAFGRANLTGLVLGCIEAKFCKKICV